MVAEVGAAGLQFGPVRVVGFQTILKTSPTSPSRQLTAFTIPQSYSSARHNSWMNLSISIEIVSLISMCFFNSGRS